jgi:hypothetical protein
VLERGREVGGFVGARGLDCEGGLRSSRWEQGIVGAAVCRAGGRSADVVCRVEVYRCRIRGHVPVVATKRK